MYACVNTNRFKSGFYGSYIYLPPVTRPKDPNSSLQHRKNRKETNMTIFHHLRWITIGFAVQTLLLLVSNTGVLLYQWQPQQQQQQQQQH